MITINIISVGSLKEKYWSLACSEYAKRISGYAKINIIEVPESRLNKGASKAEIEKAKKKEADNLFKKAKGYFIALEVKGNAYTSEQLAQKIKNLSVDGVSEISFFIGGSNGLDKNFSDNCNLKLSFSSFTFPHQLMRVVLLEQIYRAVCINNGKTYHK